MVDWVGGYAPFPTINMLRNIVIEGEVIVALCFIVGLMLGWYHAHKKGFAMMEEERIHPDTETEGTIGCEGCGKYTPLHIWEMLGLNCYYGTCVGGRWLLEDWIKLYNHAIVTDNRNMLNELQAGFNHINHDEYIKQDLI